jgi:hypothetical protein
MQDFDNYQKTEGVSVEKAYTGTIPSWEQKHGIILKLKLMTLLPKGDKHRDTL